MVDSTHSTPQRILELFPSGLELHYRTLFDAWSKTNAAALFWEAEQHARWALAFDSDADMARSYDLLRRAAHEICTFPPCAELCDIEFVYPRLCETLHNRVRTDEPALKLPLRVRRVWEGQQHRITAWHDGIPDIEGLDPAELPWLTRYLKWATPTLRGETVPAGGRPPGTSKKHPNFPDDLGTALIRIWDTEQHDVPTRERVAEELALSVDTLDRRFEEFPGLWPPAWPPTILPRLN